MRKNSVPSGCVSIYLFIYLNWIFTILQFEISSLMNWIFSLFQTWILQATAGRKIQFKLGKHPVHQTRYFKKENCKNQVQIDRGSIFIPWIPCLIWFFFHTRDYWGSESIIRKFNCVPPRKSRTATTLKLQGTNFTPKLTHNQHNTLR